MVTLQFSTTSHLSSALIRWGTWSWCSHVDLVLPDGRLLGAIPGGVQIHAPDRDMTRAERYVADYPFDEYYELAASQIGKPYDWRATVGWPFRATWQDPNAWDCSACQLWVTLMLGRPFVNATAGELKRITPRDLLLSPLLRRCDNAEGWACARS